MAFDQNITYRVNVDDTNFQSKLTQMRASLDSTVAGGFGRAMSYVGPMGNFGGGGAMGLQGGFADFGANVQPVTYTPPAIAMQPHFGMFQIQQSLSQAGLASGFGGMGIGVNQMFSSAGMRRDVIPPNMSYAEYIQYSTRAMGDRAASAGTAFAGAAMNLGAGIVGASIGSGIASMAGMGAIGAFAMPLAASMAVAAPVGMAVDRAADHAAIQSTLASGSFRFFQGSGADPVTGRGFSRNDRAGIATAITRMESNDARLGMSDYRQVLEGGMQMDLFSGTRDAEDFKQKFKGLVDTVKTVSSTLHTSLKEGLETIRGMRDMGVTDPVAQQSMVMRAEVMGRASGRTGMEMMAIGQTGAEMFRGTGISMQRGFELNTQNASMVRQMLNTGAISRETVAHAGGELSLAQQMTANALSSFQTLQGRGFMMAAFNPASMSLDPSMIGKIAGGDVIGGMSNAAAVMSNPGNMIRFQAHQHDMISKMNPMQMQLFSTAQTAAMANQMMQSGLAGDASFEDTFMAMGLRSGKSHEIVKAELGMIKMDPNKMRANMQNQMQQMGAQMAMEGQRDGILGYKFFTNMFTRAVTQPMAESIANFGAKVGANTEDMLTDVRQFITGEVDSRVLNANSAAAGEQIVQNRLSRAVNAAKARGITDPAALEQVAREEYRKSTGIGKVERLEDTSASKIAGLFGDEYGGTVAALSKFATGDEKVGGTVRTNTGINMRVFASAQQVEEYERTNNVNMKIVTSKNGKTYAVSTEDIGASVEGRRGMYGAEADIEKAKQKFGDLSSADMATIMKMGGGVASVGKYLLGDKFNMKDFKSGAYSGEVYESMKMISDQMGIEFDSFRDTSKAAGLIHRSAAGAAGTAKDALEQIAKSANVISGKGEFGITGDSDLTNLLESSKSADAAAALSKFSAGKVEEATADLAKAYGGGKEGWSKAQKDIKALKKAGASSDKKTLDAYNRLFDNIDAFGGELASNKLQQGQMAGSDLLAAGGFAGAIGPKELEAMVTMSKNLEVQMNTLIALQEKLKSVMNKK